MSNNYVTQPPTSAKVIIYTTHGELDVELWARETPLACRNFIQLSLEGYYDNTIFHRLIPGFMIQGGDPTGTGQGGQSIYGHQFADQFHQRLKFVHRGLLAMANVGRNTNKSQFFITFGECVHLNKKHTIFGKVVGNTMYNLMTMQSLDTDSNDRPMEPPMIKRAKVIINPFDDIKPRNLLSKEQEFKKIEKEKEDAARKAEQELLEKKEATKKLKKKQLLSFQDEEDVADRQMKESKVKVEEDSIPVPKKKGMVSSHDVLDDKRLSKKVVITPQELEERRKARQLEQKKKQELKAKILEAEKQKALDEEAIKQEEQDQRGEHFRNVQAQQDELQGQLRQEMHRKRKREAALLNGEQNPVIRDEVENFKTRINPETGKRQIYWGDDNEEEEEQESSHELEQIEDEQLRRVRELQKQQYEAIRADTLKFKEAQEGSLHRQEKIDMMHEKTLLSTVERKRMEFLQKQKIEKHEGSMLDKLEAFKKKLHSKQEGSDWTTHKLKFHIDSDNAFKQVQKQAGRNQGEVDDGGLMVIDQEKQDDYILKRQGMDVDELFRLTKQNN